MFLDFVGDQYSAYNPFPVPDDDPLDECTSGSHGTHVAGIIAANATGMSQTGFIPIAPFFGVAPQATLGAYRIFGCAGDTTGSGTYKHEQKYFAKSVLCLYNISSQHISRCHDCGNLSRFRR
ncbi:unnamed protein product [Rotaria sp. Silwood2]|nr:unnamed protein product [Rotaria sp. Silwood2]CAF3007265.1 unnamed protein product [Rotaria sp. Silwood2]CAF3265051.1 unnamed protein product [Rotaria sp. Silwood2]CAF3359400.1 unnamed protein product [Rotaria sp. Silwood2]